MRSTAAERQQLLHCPLRGGGIRLRAGEHLVCKQGRHAVKQHASPLRQCGALQRPAALDRAEAPARALVQMAGDAGAVLAVHWLHRRPVVQGISCGKMLRQTLGARALAALGGLQHLKGQRTAAPLAQPHAELQEGRKAQLLRSAAVARLL